MTDLGRRWRTGVRAALITVIVAAPVACDRLDEAHLDDEESGDPADDDAGDGGDLEGAGAQVRLALDVWYINKNGGGWASWDTVARSRMRNLLRAHLVAGDRVYVVLPGEYLYSDPQDFTSPCDDRRWRLFWSLKDELYTLLHGQGVLVETRVDFYRMRSQMTDSRGYKRVSLAGAIGHCFAPVMQLDNGRKPWWLSYDWESGDFSGDEWPANGAFDQATTDALLATGQERARAIGSHFMVIPARGALDTSALDWTALSARLDGFIPQTQRYLCGMRTQRNGSTAGETDRDNCDRNGYPMNGTVRADLFASKVEGLGEPIRTARGAGFLLAAEVSHNWSNAFSIWQGVSRSATGTGAVAEFYIWHERASFPDGTGLWDLLAYINERRGH